MGSGGCGGLENVVNIAEYNNGAEVPIWKFPVGIQCSGITNLFF